MMMDTSYCMSHSSLAHTYGNVTCFIAEYIKSLFPKNYFRTVHISSTIAYRQFNIFQNSKKEFIKKTKPMLIIRPRIELNDSDVFLYNTFLTTRMTDNYMETSFTNLQPFISDTERGLHIKFLLNRLKMFFDVTIVSETQIQQLNQAHFFKNRVRQDKPFFLQTSLENFIPREIFEMMSRESGIPLYDENGSVKPFLDYLNSISIYPISYKIKNSTGNDEFFRFYPVNIDTTIQGLSIDDGSKRGMVGDIFTTSFTVSTEFNAAGLYYYFPKDPTIIDQYTQYLEISDVGDSRKLIPYFTIDNVYVNKIAEGWNVYASPMFKVDPESSRIKPDILPLDGIFNNSLIKMIEYHTKHGLSFDLFMRTIVMKDNQELQPVEDYDINFDNMTLITKNINPDSTYRLIIHVNTMYINQLINDVYNLDEEK